MKTRTFIASLQTFFGATKSELTVVTVLFAGLSAGLILRAWYSGSASASALDAAGVDRLIDSIAVAEQTTYTGIMPDGSAVPELAAGDTVVEHNTPFPAAKKEEPSVPVDLNTATKEQLMTLPGVGPATADKIMAMRSEQPFRRPEDIMRVRGIGVKKFEAMRRYITVGSRRQHSRQ